MLITPGSLTKRSVSLGDGLDRQNTSRIAGPPDEGPVLPDIRPDIDDAIDVQSLEERSKVPTKKYRGRLVLSKIEDPITESGRECSKSRFESFDHTSTPGDL
jgi:hypothetical protein